MMKGFNFNAATKAILGAGLLSLTLVGCGSDGKDGEDGKDGVIGVNIDSTATLKATFTNATLESGKLTVDFALENANGVAVLGLTKDHDLRFGIAQLAKVTEKIGEGSTAVEANRGFQWQAYINSKKAPGTVPPDVTNIKPSAQFQAGVESANKCSTCLVSHGDGTYTYTFQTNIANVTEPLKVAFDANNTHRATLELELPQIVANAHYDWQPASGKTEGIQTRDVVSIETCYTCHQPESIALHGGRRIDVENCASCHTNTSGDPETGNSVDWTYMIHAIHKGEERQTYSPTEAKMVQAPYKVIGYGGSVHDYGKVMYPQHPAADCAACHKEGEGAPANADLFKADLSNTACIACHTELPSDTHFKYNSGTNCMQCHVEGGYARSAKKAHGDATKSYKLSQNYSAKFSNIKVNDKVLTFDVQILDDKGQPVAKEFIADPSQYTKSSIYFSWDINKDYPAYQAGSKYSDRGFALNNTDVSTYNEATKTFSINSSKSNLVLPAEGLKGKSVELFAGVATCFQKGGYGVSEVTPMACNAKDDEGNSKVTTAYIQHEPLRFVWNDTDTSEAAKARRPIIDDASCTSCHNQEIKHYDNGVNCQACHTPDKGLSRSKEPTSFAYKAHHAPGHYLKYAGVQSGTVLKTDCATCHAKDSKTGELVGIKLGQAPERVWRYADKAGAEIFTSSDAGACLSCHQKYLGDAAKSHIETNGGIIDGTSADDVRNRAKESCSTCHTPEQVFGLHNK